MEQICVGTCPTGVLTLGDLNDPDSPLLQRLAQKDNFVSAPDYGSDPAVHYLTSSRLAPESLKG